MKIEKKKSVIKKIILEIKGKEISLTLEEAKELREELGKLNEKEYIYNPTLIPYHPTCPRSDTWYFDTSSETRTILPTTITGSLTYSNN